MSHDDLRIRPMIDADCPRVSEVLCACFRWLGEREGFTQRQLDHLLEQRSCEATVRAEAASRPHFVACIDGRVVGMAVVNGDELARLYVHPDCHRCGIGRRLFETARDAIREAGHREMKVGALVDSARVFYEAMGMTASDTVPWEPAIFGDRRVTILTMPL